MDLSIFAPCIMTTYKTRHTEPLHIEVKGARTHNLKNITVRIPRNQLTVITGVSGSGKSSLAFDTIYAEGQRRYLDSLSTYSRQFIGNVERPDVDHITGLSPVISIEQKSINKNPRSTVGTITELYDFLRLLYARVSEAFSYRTDKKMIRFSEEQIVSHLFEKFVDKKIIFLAPAVKGRKGHYRELFEQIRKQGYLKVRVDGIIQDIKPRMQVDRYKIHDIEIVVDRLSISSKNEQRIRKSIIDTLELGEGLMMIQVYKDTNQTYTFSKDLVCADTGISYPLPSPNSFSFNSPYGACPQCKGIGLGHEINLDKVIIDNTISIANGGIVPFGKKRDNPLFKDLKKIATQYNFNLKDPIKDIPLNGLNRILYGQEKKGGLGYNASYQKIGDWHSLDYGLVGLLHYCFAYSDTDSVVKWAESFMDKISCSACKGYRLNKTSLHFKIDHKHIGEVSDMNIQALFTWVNNLSPLLEKKQQIIAKDLLKEIRTRLSFLLDVGLDYLSLNRSSKTLSGGEAQRIRLATQIGSKLEGITYILDEPSIGLHQKDNAKLIASLKELVKIGNTVIVVEHDEDIMHAADYIIDIGPKAGTWGGEVIAQGRPAKFKKQNSTTAKYLNKVLQIALPQQRRSLNSKKIILRGASGNNLKKIDISLPLKTLICVTGVSGSGKSTLISETLYPILNQHFFRAKKAPYPYDSIHGLEHIDKVIEIDQAPIGRTPRSTPATYIKVFDEIRKLFSQTAEAQIRGYKPGRFSFNTKGGRCEVCQGGGVRIIEMNFLPNVEVECEQCLGKRYNKETLEITYKKKHIAQVLDMTVNEAIPFFESIPKIYTKIKTLQDVGLGYIKLGQSSTSLSGGEAQRVKLATELSRKDTGNTFYILDEPTTGLHFQDVNILLDVLQKLVDKGNTVLIIEHHIDVIKTADYIIDIGPNGGEKGGGIVAEGTPEQICQYPKSYTGQFLKKVIK